jgi:hypothetical protein
MSRVNDTSSDVERVRLELLRRKTPTERLAMGIRLSEHVIAATKKAIARTHPDMPARERDYLYVELQYGKQLADSLRDFERKRP